MKKITKKEFKALHSSNKIALVQSCFKRTKEEVSNAIEIFNHIIEGIPVSRVDLSNHGDYEVIEVFKKSINHQIFYFVESRIDNSKNPNCSWDDIEYNTIAYVLK